jgi:pimeloyl-ACP methyl ester carboxylesterase
MRFIKILLVLFAIIFGSIIGFVYWAPEKAYSVGLDLDRHRSSLSRKEIDLADGLHYVYLEGGNGEPLMLLHGFGMNKDAFTRVARYLTPHYRVIIPDAIGFGESSHPQGANYSIPAQMERLRSLAHALGLERLHLGGSSMGGQIALTYAARYPGEVISLWLLNPAGIWSSPPSEVFNIFKETGRNMLMVKNEDDFEQCIQFIIYKPPYIPGFIKEIMAQERIRNYNLEDQVIKQIVAYEVEKSVSGLTIPALIVWGDKDRVLNPASAEILHNLMPRSQVIIMRNTGHLPMMEQARQSSEDYLRFRSDLHL